MVNPPTIELVRGLPLRLVDNGDGSYSVATVVVSGGAGPDGTWSLARNLPIKLSGLGDGSYAIAVSAAGSSLNLTDPATAGAVGDGTTNDAAAFQAIFDAGDIPFVGNGKTYLIDSGVFLDGASSLTTYAIVGDGTGTVKIGANCPTVSTFVADPTIKFGFHVNNLRAALSGGAVTYNDANRATGGGFPTTPRLIVRDVIIDGAATTAFGYGNTCQISMERCVVRGVKYGWSWRGYSDGGRFSDVNCESIASGGWLCWQASQGDNMWFENVKALGQGIWHASTCYGGSIITCIQGGWFLDQCKAIRMVGCHAERSSLVPWLDVSQSHVTVESLFTMGALGSSGRKIRVNDTTSDQTSPTDLTIRQWTAMHYFASGDNDGVRSPDLYVEAANAGTRIRVFESSGATLRNTLSEWNPSGLLFAANVAGITSAITAARHLVASEAWELRQQNGTWEIGAPSPLAQVRSERLLVAPTYLSQPGAATLAPGSLGAGVVVEYAMALRDADGNYGAVSAASTQFTTTSTGSTIWQAVLPTTPATLVVWRKNGGAAGAVLTAPDRYVEIPVNGYRTKITDTGVNINGIPWITTAVPVPNTVAGSNTTWDHVTLLGGLELPEITAPPNAPTNKARLYVEDNGSGKSRLVVKFPTGTAIVVATEA